MNGSHPTRLPSAHARGSIPVGPERTHRTENIRCVCRSIVSITASVTSLLSPNAFEPLLKLGDLARALNLNIQLDVLGQSGFGEIPRTNQSLRADDLKLRVSDVGLRMELVPVVDAALDLSRMKRVKNCRDTFEKRINFLISFDTVVQAIDGSCGDRFQESLASR